MSRIEQFVCTLTGATDSETLNSGLPIFGRLVCVEINNGASSAQPSDNWDIEIYQGTASGNDDKSLFYDETVSQGNTTAIVYYPVVAAAVASTGEASTLTEVTPVINGVVKVTGANMGASKTAVVKIYVEVA